MLEPFRDSDTGFIDAASPAAHKFRDFIESILPA